MPAENGSVTPRVAAAATAASTALPPDRSTSRPTCVAVGSTVATAPPQPTAVGPSAAGSAGAGGHVGCAAAGETAATAATSAPEVRTIRRWDQRGFPMALPSDPACCGA